MRILHIDTGREMRGGQWQVLFLLRGLRERNLPAIRLLARGELLARASAEGFDAAEASPFAVRGAGVDVIHAHDAKSHTWAAALEPGRLVVARRVVYPVKQGLLSKWKYLRARRYIAISQAVKSELERAGVPASKIDVVFDGVPAPERVIPYEERPANRFLAICKAPDLAPSADLQLQFSPQIADDLSTARGLVYLSRSEGLGSAALLAMANAVPVVASRTGGLVEAVEDGVTGVLVDRAAEVVAAVGRLREDPEWAAKLGLAGRERALERFSLDNMVDGTLRVYEKVLEGE